MDRDVTLCRSMHVTLCSGMHVTVCSGIQRGRLGVGHEARNSNFEQRLDERHVAARRGRSQQRASATFVDDERLGAMACNGG